jgi:hypothetical protein
MYSAVSARGIEIATLRAIGFGDGAVATSVHRPIERCGAIIAVSALGVLHHQFSEATGLCAETKSHLAGLSRNTPALFRRNATFAGGR